MGDEKKADPDALDFCNTVMRCLQKSEIIFLNMDVFLKKSFKFYMCLVILSLSCLRGLFDDGKFI